MTSHTWQRRELFRRPQSAQILLEQLLDCRDRGFYRLHAFVIMPEHFHALLTPGEKTSLERVMQMIKGGSAHRIRKEIGGRFPIWQPGYHDRWIRNAEEYRVRKLYLEQNPVKAKLAEKPEEYPLSSASGTFALDSGPFDVLTSGAEAPA